MTFALLTGIAERLALSKIGRGTFMFQFLRGVVLITAVMLNFAGAVFAEEKDYDSANAMMPVCREAIKSTNAINDPLRFLMQGNCMGIVAG